MIHKRVLITNLFSYIGLYTRRKIDPESLVNLGKVTLSEGTMDNKSF